MFKPSENNKALFGGAIYSLLLHILYLFLFSLEFRLSNVKPLIAGNHLLSVQMSTEGTKPWGCVQQNASANQMKTMTLFAVHYLKSWKHEMQSAKDGFWSLWCKDGYALWIGHLRHTYCRVYSALYVPKQLTRSEINHTPNKSCDPVELKWTDP